jgi:glycogen debranching enzyme
MRRIFSILFLFFAFHCYAQDFSCDNPSVKAAYKLAVQTVDINTRRGILAAGADYGGEWTRDIAINSWNGVSLLRPQVAVHSLWSVTINKDTIGHQYWDKIIWTIAAYNHYLVTGDKAFLAQAYFCSANTMNQLEHKTFDANYDLFMGPSVFNDGIAAYPRPIFDTLNYSSGVLDHKNSIYIKCLSTNCVYYGAYLALSKMSIALHKDKKVTADYQQKAESLKKNILKYLYDNGDNSFYYLIDQNGKVHKYQEALGISFAVIFGIIDKEKANQLIHHTVVSKYGITSIYPDFSRYSPEKLGRHNNIIWPMVNGFFAKASLVAGDDSSFTKELFGLTHLALDEDKGNYDFREIYNPNTGKPDGGWQANGPQNRDYHWESCKLQTWSATAYISMILNGLFGFRFSEKLLSFSPFLPSSIHFIEMKGLKYRHCILNVSIKGNGKSIKSFLLDGKEQVEYSISSTIKGKHDIMIVLQ